MPSRPNLFHRPSFAIAALVAGLISLMLSAGPALDMAAPSDRAAADGRSHAL